jgi:hypothetical protein
MSSTLQEQSTGKLLALLQQAGKALAANSAYSFANVHRLIECLPLTSAPYCFAPNWLSSVQELGKRGECATACYPGRLLAKQMSFAELPYQTPRTAPVSCSP